VNFYAHTLENEPQEKWEPLFSADCQALAGGDCDYCEPLDRRHAHLNPEVQIGKKKAGYSVEHCPLNLIIATKRTTSSDQLPTTLCTKKCRPVKLQISL
jgi:hypothetical protein